MLVLFALGGSLRAWQVAASLTAILAVLCGNQSLTERRTRRHLDDGPRPTLHETS